VEPVFVGEIEIMHPQNGWLGFELSVLRRLKFSSVAFPFTGEPDTPRRIKQWKVRIAANDPMVWSHTKSTALLENQTEQLSTEEVDTLLEDAYVPAEKLNNPALLRWFNEADAWWFDNVRLNAETLSPFKRALALTIGMMVGDYVLSFNDETKSLRKPLALSSTFRFLIGQLPAPYDNALRNRSCNQDIRSFIAERHHTDLLFLRLPVPATQAVPERNQIVSWREEWLRGNDEFWTDFEKELGAKLGTRVLSKQQYLGFVEDLLRTASHIPSWAIAHTENGFISTEELVEKVGRVRKVSAVYSKDFSDLLGVRAAILVAAS
jgi:hypothetical protein